MLDASVLCRFAEDNALSNLRAYLGDRTRITREVERELLRLAERPEFAELTEHLEKDGPVAKTDGKWPKLTKNLPDALKDDFARLLDVQLVLGEHERAHAGEIATVLIAKHRGSELVIMDDNWGASLARKTYGLEVMSTARLTLEMVVSGALNEEEGFRIFDSATPDDVGRERFTETLRRLRRSV
jgi:hypothetical protein